MEPLWKDSCTYTMETSVKYKLQRNTIGIGAEEPGSEAKDFPSSFCVQTSSEAHPASQPMSTAGPFPGVKSDRDMTLTTHSHLVTKSKMSRSYTYPLGACIA
jgi:hypothetical protein